MNSEEEVIKSSGGKMDRAVKTFAQELKGIRTGRASANLLDRINVDYYGTQTPLKQLSTISVPEPQLITINPWDKSTIAAIEKAVLSSQLGITPSNDGNIIRLNLPPLTEERRKELIKVVRNLGEDAKVSIRNIRREANENLKKLKDDGNISEDDYFREHDVVQKITDEHTKKIDELIKAKEEDLMQV